MADDRPCGYSSSVSTALPYNSYLSLDHLDDQKVSAINSRFTPVLWDANNIATRANRDADRRETERQSRYMLQSHLDAGCTLRDMLDHVKIFFNFVLVRMMTSHNVDIVDVRMLWHLVEADGVKWAFRDALRTFGFWGADQKHVRLLLAIVLKLDLDIERESNEDKDIEYAQIEEIEARFDELNIVNHESHSFENGMYDNVSMNNNNGSNEQENVHAGEEGANVNANDNIGLVDQHPCSQDEEQNVNNAIELNEFPSDAGANINMNYTDESNEFPARVSANSNISSSFQFDSKTEEATSTTSIPRYPGPAVTMSDRPAPGTSVQQTNGTKSPKGVRFTSNAYTQCEKPNPTDVSSKKEVPLCEYGRRDKGTYDPPSLNTFRARPRAVRKPSPEPPPIEDADRYTRKPYDWQTKSYSRMEYRADRDIRREVGYKMPLVYPHGPFDPLSVLSYKVGQRSSLAHYPESKSRLSVKSRGSKSPLGNSTARPLNRSGRPQSPTDSSHKPHIPIFDKPWHSKWSLSDTSDSKRPVKPRRSKSTPDTELSSERSLEHYLSDRIRYSRSPIHGQNISHSPHADIHRRSKSTPIPSPERLSGHIAHHHRPISPSGRYSERDIRTSVFEEPYYSSMTTYNYPVCPRYTTEPSGKHLRSSSPSTLSPERLCGHSDALPGMSHGSSYYRSNNCSQSENPSSGHTSVEQRGSIELTHTPAHRRLSFEDPPERRSALAIKSHLSGPTDLSREPSDKSDNSRFPAGCYSETFDIPQNSRSPFGSLTEPSDKHRNSRLSPGRYTELSDKPRDSRLSPGRCTELSDKPRDSRLSPGRFTEPSDKSDNSRFPSGRYSETLDIPHNSRSPSGRFTEPSVKSQDSRLSPCRFSESSNKFLNSRSPSDHFSEARNSRLSFDRSPERCDISRLNSIDKPQFSRFSSSESSDRFHNNQLKSENSPERSERPRYSRLSCDSSLENSIEISRYSSSSSERSIERSNRAQNSQLKSEHSRKHSYSSLICDSSLEKSIDNPSFPLPSERYLQSSDKSQNCLAQFMTTPGRSKKPRHSRLPSDASPKNHDKPRHSRLSPGKPQYLKTANSNSRKSSSALRHQSRLPPDRFVERSGASRYSRLPTDFSHKRSDDKEMDSRFQSPARFHSTARSTASPKSFGVRVVRHSEYAVKPSTWSTRSTSPLSAGSGFTERSSRPTTRSPRSSSSSSTGSYSIRHYTSPTDYHPERYSPQPDIPPNVRYQFDDSYKRTIESPDNLRPSRIKHSLDSYKANSDKPRRFSPHPDKPLERHSERHDVIRHSTSPARFYDSYESEEPTGSVTSPTDTPPQRPSSPGILRRRVTKSPGSVERRKSVRFAPASSTIFDESAPPTECSSNRHNRASMTIPTPSRRHSDYDPLDSLNSYNLKRAIDSTAAEDYRNQPYNRRPTKNNSVTRDLPASYIRRPDREYISVPTAANDTFSDTILSSSDGPLTSSPMSGGTKPSRITLSHSFPTEPTVSSRDNKLNSPDESMPDHLLPSAADRYQGRNYSPSSIASTRSTRTSNRPSPRKQLFASHVPSPRTRYTDGPGTLAEPSPSRPGSPSIGRCSASPSTGRRPGSPSIGRRPDSPSIGRRPASPSTGRRPGSPSIGRRPASPSTGRRPASPSTGRRPASPSTGRRPGSPSNGRRSASPSIGRRPDSPSIGRRSISPSTGRRPDSPSIGRRSISPSIGRRPDSPSIGRRPDSPLIGRRPASPSIGRRSASPSTGRRPDSPSIGRRPGSPLIGRRPDSPSIGRRTDSPSIGRRPDSPLIGRRPDSPLIGRRSASPSIGRRPGSPLIDRRPDSPSIGRRPDSPLIGRRPDSPSIGRRPDSPLIGRRSASPSIGRRPGSPLIDRRPDLPSISSRRTRSPSNGRRPASPSIGRRPASPISSRRSASPSIGRRTCSAETGRRTDLPLYSRRTGYPLPPSYRCQGTPTTGFNSSKQLPLPIRFGTLEPGTYILDVRPFTRKRHYRRSPKPSPRKSNRRSQKPSPKTSYRRSPKTSPKTSYRRSPKTSPKFPSPITATNASCMHRQLRMTSPSNRLLTNDIALITSHLVMDLPFRESAELLQMDKQLIDVITRIAVAVMVNINVGRNRGAFLSIVD